MRAKQFLPLSLLVATVCIIAGVAQHGGSIDFHAQAQEIVPGPAVVVEAPGPVQSFLDMLKSSEGRDLLLIKLGELREAMLLLPPVPGDDKRQEILREVEELEQLMQQYQKMKPPTRKGG